MLRKIIACCGIDGNVESLDYLKSLVIDQNPDAILFAGGLNACGQASSCGDKLSPEQVDLYRQFFDVVGNTDAWVALIPGVDDVPADEFMRYAMAAETDFPNIHVVHGTLFEDKGTAYCGIGGCLVEHKDPNSRRWEVSRSEAEYGLRQLWRSDASRKVLLLNSAPNGSLGGEQGSTIAGELIDSYHPSICVVAGCSENRGIDRVAHTTIINPGRLSDGFAAAIDLKKPVEEQVEMLELKEVSRKA